MSVISELVDKLRTEAESMGKYGTSYMATLLMKSVDAIEMLSEKVREQKQKWIPCEERLPETDGLYLATFTLIGIPKFTNVEKFKNNEWECHNGYIIAWQPLPEPWEGTNDETD